MSLKDIFAEELNDDDDDVEFVPRPKREASKGASKAWECLKGDRSPGSSDSNQSDNSDDASSSYSGDNDKKEEQAAEEVESESDHENQMEEGSDHDNAPLNSRIFGSIPEHFSNIKVPVFTKDVDTIIQSVLADKEYMERMIAEQDPELDRLNAEHEELKAAANQIRKDTKFKLDRIASLNQAILKITSNLAFGFSILYQRLNFNAIQKSASNVALDRVEDKVENVEEGQGRRKSRRITVKAETVAVKVEEIGPLIGHEKIPALLEELGKCK